MVTDFTSVDLTGSVFEDVCLARARFHDVDLAGADFRLMNLTGVRIRDALLVDMTSAAKSAICGSTASTSFPWWRGNSTAATRTGTR